MQVKRIHRNEVTSTNTYIKELLAADIELSELTLVDADFQTGGRGQTGCSWESERGKNLTFSLVCHPTFLLATSQFILSQTIAVAITRVLKELSDEFCIKWPNDIYWRNRKICGTLIECNLASTQIKDCIIGTGLNINQEEFRSDAPNPISLAQIVGFSLNRDVILDKIINSFCDVYQMLKEGKHENIRREYMQSLYRRTGWFLYQEPDGEPFEAEVIDVEHSGHLLLRYRNGKEKSYELKEIKIII